MLLLWSDHSKWSRILYNTCQVRELVSECYFGNDSHRLSLFKWVILCVINSVVPYFVCSNLQTFLTSSKISWNCVQHREICHFNRDLDNNNNNNNRLMALCPGLPGWARARRNILSLTPVLVIDHPVSSASDKEWLMTLNSLLNVCDSSELSFMNAVCKWWRTKDCEFRHRSRHPLHHRHSLCHITHLHH